MGILLVALAILTTTLVVVVWPTPGASLTDDDVEAELAAREADRELEARLALARAHDEKLAEERERIEREKAERDAEEDRERRRAEREREAVARAERQREIRERFQDAPTRFSARGSMLAVDSEPLFDRCWMPSTIGRVYFFQSGIGYQDPDGPTSAAKTPADTNLATCGRLPEPEQFEVLGLSLVPDEGVDPDDVQRLKDDAVLDWVWGCGSRLRRWVGRELVTDDATVPRFVFPKGDEILIALNENFGAELTIHRPFETRFRVTLYVYGWHAKGVSRVRTAR